MAAVRAAGLEQEATARAGEPLGLVDESPIPFSLHGYVAVALDRGLIDLLPGDDGLRFDPKGKVLRVTAARFLPRLLDLRSPP